MRIKITENGPYEVTGGIKIREMVITPKGNHFELVEGRILPQAETYHLCRCGNSANAPFCDGEHIKSGFDGTETASKEPYKKRIVDVTFGHDMNLLDDGRCAFARFCHTDRGDIWTLTENANNPENKEAAIKAARECPAGRLTMVDLDGNAIEESFEPEIIILQDPQQNASAGIFVKGPVILESADGTEYEIRNRMALCRCGQSKNKPFCDAFHVQIGFNDGYFKKDYAETTK